jgi:hypothetical protein
VTPRGLAGDERAAAWERRERPNFAVDVVCKSFAEHARVIRLSDLVGLPNARARFSV